MLVIMTALTFAPVHWVQDSCGRAGTALPAFFAGRDVSAIWDA